MTRALDEAVPLSRFGSTRRWGILSSPKDIESDRSFASSPIETRCRRSFRWRRRWKARRDEGATRWSRRRSGGLARAWAGRSSRPRSSSPRPRSAHWSSTPRGSSAPARTPRLRRDRIPREALRRRRGSRETLGSPTRRRFGEGEMASPGVCRRSRCRSRAPRRRLRQDRRGDLDLGQIWDRYVVFQMVNIIYYRTAICKYYLLSRLWFGQIGTSRRVCVTLLQLFFILHVLLWKMKRRDHTINDIDFLASRCWFFQMVNIIYYRTAICKYYLLSNGDL